MKLSTIGKVTLSAALLLGGGLGGYTIGKANNDELKVNVQQKAEKEEPVSQSEKYDYPEGYAPNLDEAKRLIANEVDNYPNTAITYRMDRVIEELNGKAEKLRPILQDSYRVIDGFRVGTNQVAGYGTFLISHDGLEKRINRNYLQFKELFKEELAQIEKQITENGGQFSGDTPNKDGVIYNNALHSDAQAIIWNIDRGFKMALKNFVRPVGKESVGVNEWSLMNTTGTETGIVKARDIFQRYDHYLFGGKYEIDGFYRDREN